MGPAHLLEGRDLANGWKAVERIDRPPGSTGGCFSVGYKVAHPDGRRAFLKALDFSREFGSPNAADRVALMLDAYRFERDLSFECLDRRLTRIVAPLDHGSVRVDGYEYPDVFYIIYEFGETGDIRKCESFLDQADYAWRYRVLHEVATGLRQLHSTGVAHQDVKPSNVIIFDGLGSKIADLGTASAAGRDCPRDALNIAGDPSYAPPELAYRVDGPDWRGRVACDVYLLGSLAYTLFAGINLTPEIVRRLDKRFRPAQWCGSYTGLYSDALPVVIDAWDEAMDELERVVAGVAPNLAQNTTTMIRQLTHPNPGHRGHPKNLHGATPHALQRYVANFDLLSRKCHLGQM